MEKFNTYSQESIVFDKHIIERLSEEYKLGNLGYAASYWIETLYEERVQTNTITIQEFIEFLKSDAAYYFSEWLENSVDDCDRKLDEYEIKKSYEMREELNMLFNHITNTISAAI